MKNNVDAISILFLLALNFFSKSFGTNFFSPFAKVLKKNARIKYMSPRSSANAVDTAFQFSLAKTRT